MKVFSVVSLVCLSLMSQKTFAQRDGDIYRTNTDLLKNIKVFQNGQELRMAWSGGVNNPQFAMADINNDGKNDMVIFEPYRGIKTFLNTGTSGSPNYIYAPDYEYLFPAAYQYLKLKDYNCDNVPDLFHFGGSGLVIAKGYYKDGNKLAFHPEKEIRYIDPEATGTVNIGINPGDIPAIEDVDNDGDMDIVTYNQLGAFVVLYRNMKVEESLDCDSFKVKRKDKCWGKMYQTFYRTHLLNYYCDNSKLKTGNKTTDGSNSLCLFDSDGDGDLDYLDGNSNYSDIQFIRNGKVEFNYYTDTMMSQDTIWQSNGTPLQMSRYPAAFWLDIDNDNDKDILVTPRGTGSENKNNVAFYENTGTATSPSYTYQSSNYLVDKMIDAGSTSYPVLYDYNRDGKLDLLVGSRGYYQSNGTFKSKITYLQNTSAGSSSSFELVTENFLSVDTMNITGSALAIGDLNNDGLDDLVIGKTDGKLLFYKNAASSSSAAPVWVPWSVDLADLQNTPIDVGSNATPLIYDIDKDGWKDLIIGCEAGTLFFYKNTDPTPGALKLELKSNKLGDVRVGFPYGHSAPFIGKIDNTNNEYLMVGSVQGWIFRFDGFQTGNTNTPYVMLDSMYANIQTKGGYSSVAIGNIDSDPEYEMFVGNELGGVNLYRKVFNVNVSEVEKGREKLLLYPNPAKDQLTVALAGKYLPATAELRIYNSMGQSVQVGSRSVANDNITLDIKGLPAGVYMCSLRFDGKTYSSVFLKNN